MKLAPNALIKDYPPMLRALALKRTQEGSSSYTDEQALELTIWSCFTLYDTPEGGEFWNNILNGREFEWEETLIYEIY